MGIQGRPRGLPFVSPAVLQLKRWNNPARQFKHRGRAPRSAMAARTRAISISRMGRVYTFPSPFVIYSAQQPMVGRGEIMLSITVWGDSIGRGVVFDEGRKRYAVAKRTYAAILEEKGILKVDNRSRCGASAAEGLADFAQAEPLSTRVVALLYGGNDCNLKWDEVAARPQEQHAAKLALPVFQQTLETFVQAVRERGHIPLLVTPPPLIAPRFIAWVSQGLDGKNIKEYVGNVQNIYHWQERYAAAVHQAAQATGCLLFDLRDAFLAQKDMESYYSVDGMHPGDKGQQLIADAISQAVPWYRDLIQSSSAVPS